MTVIVCQLLVTFCWFQRLSISVDRLRTGAIRLFPANFGFRFAFGEHHFVVQWQSWEIICQSLLHSFQILSNILWHLLDSPK